MARGSNPKSTLPPHLFFWSEHRFSPDIGPLKHFEYEGHQCTACIILHNMRGLSVCMYMLQRCRELKGAKRKLQFVFSSIMKSLWRYTPEREKATVPFCGCYTVLCCVCSFLQVIFSWFSVTWLWKDFMLMYADAVWPFLTVVNNVVL